MAKIEVFNIGKTSFCAYLTGLQTKDPDTNMDITYTRKCIWDVREKSSNNSVCNETEFITPGETEGDTQIFSGLSSNTDYVVSCTVYNDDTGVYLNSFSDDVTTKGSGSDSPWTLWGEEGVDTAMEEYDYNWYLESECIHRWIINSSKSGWVRIYTTGSVDTLGYVSRDGKMTPDNSAPLSPIASNDDYNGDVNFYIEQYVTSGTDYYVFVRGSSGSETGYVTLYITSPKDSLNTVAKWNWSASNGSASANVTYASYCALLNKEPTENFSHLVWNDMVDKVDEILTAKGLYWDSTYAGIYETKMWSEPYELTAKMFNSLRNNIELVGLSSFVNLGYKTGISAVSPGDDVMGWYFTALTEYMNDCIDNL